MDEASKHSDEIDTRKSALDDRAFVAIRFTAEQQGFLRQVAERLQVTEAEVVRMLIDGYRVYAAMFPMAAMSTEATARKKARQDGSAVRTDWRLIWLALAFLLGVILAVIYLVTKGAK